MHVIYQFPTETKLYHEVAQSYQFPYIYRGTKETTAISFINLLLERSAKL
jgi:hypothetical protein